MHLSDIKHLLNPLKANRPVPRFSIYNNGDVEARLPDKRLPPSGGRTMYGMRTSLDLSGMPRTSSTHKVVEDRMHG